ncbi:MAG: hypothetical protein AB1412_00610 [Pseudomonadota bacterium]
MMSPKPLLSALAFSLILAGGGLTATAAYAQTQKQETIYGSQLMTQKERREYRLKMREAKTAEQREQIRAEHHKQMQERAKERGVKLPDSPPAQGMHQGRPGGGMGPGGGGMGPGGGGMGPGGGGMGPGGAAKP